MICWLRLCFWWFVGKCKVPILADWYILWLWKAIKVTQNHAYTSSIPEFSPSNAIHHGGFSGMGTWNLLLNRTHNVVLKLHEKRELRTHKAMNQKASGEYKTTAKNTSALQLGKWILNSKQILYCTTNYARIQCLSYKIIRSIMCLLIIMRSIVPTA